VTHRTLLLVGLLVLAAAAPSALAYERDEFLFLDEIEIGMTGIGRTIVAADVIEEFHVEVIGIIDQPGDLSDFIVVRVSGDVIGRAGGIAQGMSGSPVFVDGKLIGALSRAANWSKEITPIGLVTPIEPMLAVLDATNEPFLVRAPNPTATLDGIRLVEVASAADPAIVAANADTIYAAPVATPLVVSGLSGRSLDLLMSGTATLDAPTGLITEFVWTGGVAPDIRGLSALGLSLLPMAASATGAPELGQESLVPGGSIGVALATGDITAGALGTVTYRDGGTVVGFGHPFISNGSSVFGLTTVNIIETMKTLDASFKLGMLGEMIGTVAEDRAAAIGGRIGPLPAMIGLSYDVHDLDRDISTVFDVEIVDEPHLVPELLLSTGFEAIDTTLDRVGPGTVEVTYHIYGDAMPRPLERKELFFSSLDVAVYPAWQLASLVAMLHYSSFDDPEITHVAASMEITEEIKGIQINHLVLDEVVYSPGDTIHFELGLQTYHGEPIVETGEIEIPSDLNSDYVFVRAYGGPRYLEAGESAVEFDNLEELIDAIESLPSYDTLTVELFATDPYSPYADALYGVAEVTFEYPGYGVYDNREEYALLVGGGGGPSAEPEPETPTDSEGGPKVNW